MKLVTSCVVLLLAIVAHADTPRSPYKLYWAFPENTLSSIDIDADDFTGSRFTSDYDLVKYLASLKKEKTKKPREGEAAAPTREVRVEQLDGEGKVRTTLHYVATLETWRKRFGEDMVERLEDEFDAHMRMIFPHGPHGPVAPIDPNEKPPAPIVAPPPTGDKVKEP